MTFRLVLTAMILLLCTALFLAYVETTGLVTAPPLLLSPTQWDDLKTPMLVSLFAVIVIRQSLFGGEGESSSFLGGLFGGLRMINRLLFGIVVSLVIGAAFLGLAFFLAAKG